jgi:hypothetical protein
MKVRFPSHWRATTLGNELPLSYGRALPAKVRDVNGSVPVYGSAGLAGHHSEPLVLQSSVVVGRKGNVGMAHLIREPCWPIDTTYFAVFRSDQDPRFFKYLLDHLDLRSLDKSTAIPSLSRDDYNAIAVGVPGLTQQQRIVAAIESHFTRLDAAVESLKRAKANVKRARASVLKAAVEGRLVPTEATLARAEGRTFEPASALLAKILDERKAAWLKSGARGKYKEPVAPDTTNLPNLPEGWCWTTIDQLTVQVTDGDHQPPPVASEGVPFLVISNVKSGLPDFTSCRLVPVSYYESLDWKRRPCSDDLLYTVVGSLGIPVRASLAEQHRIVTEVDRRLSVLDALTATLETNLARCARLRQSVLKRAFEGRLVTAQAPQEAASPVVADQLPSIAKKARR